MQYRDSACYDEAVSAWEVSDRLAMLRTEAAIPIHPVPVHLLDGPATDFQELGQFPLAHPPNTSPGCTPFAARSGPDAGRGDGPRSAPWPGPRPSAP